MHTEGADLVYEYRGQGPVLLMIAGGGGHSARHDRLADALVDSYTVVSYDRRGNSRSTGEIDARDSESFMRQQAHDARVVIESIGDSAVFVFGNSSGANIALQLAIDHPDVVDAVIANEGPTLPLLPDADHWQDFATRLHAMYLAEGSQQALRMFNAELVGFGDTGVSPPNLDVFFGIEYLPSVLFRPDLDALRANGTSVATAAGRASADAYYARTSRIQAELLGCPFIEFPGNHVGFTYAAPDFAVTLRATLDELAVSR